MLLKALFIILLSGTGQARKATGEAIASPEPGQCLIGRHQGFRAGVFSPQVTKQLNQALVALSDRLVTLAVVKKNPRQQYLFNKYKTNLNTLNGENLAKGPSPEDANAMLHEIQHVFHY